MHSLGRNNLVGYCLSSSSKKQVKIDLSLNQTVLTSTSLINGQSDGSTVNMAIADSLGCSISVNSHSLGEFAIAMDGVLTDQTNLSQNILASNMVLLSHSSEELVAYLLSQEGITAKTFPTILKNFLAKHPGGYSVIIMAKGRIFAARDCYGIKPLVIGRLQETREVMEFDLEGDEPQMKTKLPNIIASSSTILENMGAKYIRQVLPGEVVELGPNGLSSVGLSYRKSGNPSTMCSMEYIAMTPASSFLEEQRVQNVQYRLGQALAVDSPAESECVITLPNISLAFALGYVQKSGKCLVEAFYYCTSGTDPNRLSLYSENVADKDVTLVIDSSLNLDIDAALGLLKNSAAKKIHLRVCSPPIVSSCPFGITMVVPGPAGARAVDSVGHLRVESLSRTILKKIPDNEVKNVGHCFHCFGTKHSMQSF